MVTRRNASELLVDGLHERLWTAAISNALDGRAHRLESIDGDATRLLLDLLSEQLMRALASLESGEQSAARQVALAAGVLARARRLLARERLGEVLDASACPEPPLRLLRQVGRPDRRLPTPAKGLIAPSLFTAGAGAPSLLHELRQEIAGCDGLDILVSFITTGGVRKIVDVLRPLGQGGPGGAPVPIRVLTTTYTGATEADAIDTLAALPGCQVRVSLDGRRTRLHAKAWLFRRASGFGAAYIGSANLSRAALADGIEWTVKLTQRGQPDLFACAEAHFETLWADREFEPYNTHDEGHRSALRRALQRESRRGDKEAPFGPALRGFFDLQPKPFQLELLEELDAERALGRHRLLLVAATGTGKTVVAAFDYRRQAAARGGSRPRLLFVAHREEILRQALRTFREVLHDPEFGVLLAGGHEPAAHDHLFATIDSVDGRELVARFGADFWHTVVIDECHRIAGARFDRMCQALRPQQLLGLTATPERSDGEPIARYFDMRPDGSPAAELRLWHALELQLLAPFEYYGCDDPTDLSAIPWDEAGEREALGALLAGNQVRARLVVSEWLRIAGAGRMRRALAFCVTVAHAEFMAAHFNAAGLRAMSVTAGTDRDQRASAPAALARGDLDVLVTVDLYNEGVDLPFVDTLLLLRPTQSAIVFQQQIGRGLRLHDGKESCLVLDFVGRHRSGFRFDRLLGGLVGFTRRELLEAVDAGFEHLPAGCHIQLQPQAREQVLASLRQVSGGHWRAMKRELIAYAALRRGSPPTLAAFLHEQALRLEDVYRDTGPGGWTTLRREAGLLAADVTTEEAYFSRRFASLLHTDDTDRLAAMKSVASGVAVADASTQMLAYQVDGANDRIGSAVAFRDRLRANPDCLDELGQLADALESQARHMPQLPGLEDTPLRLHARYGVREVLTACGWLTPHQRQPFQAGTLVLADRGIELLFVTLDKRAGYHDRIAYRDYAIDPETFHWQSQHHASRVSAAGRRYLGADGGDWQFQLFVRENPHQAYVACGPVDLVSAEGERPITIVWRLKAALPARLFAVFSVLGRG
jgi:superfamily II DNA or RNA helicase/HKD family nuclease